MPWDVRKNGNWWEIYKPGSNKVVGRSTSKTKAESSVRARYAGARAGGERLSENLSMHEIERAAVAVVELNELAGAGWEVQTILFCKDAYLKRDKALSKAKEMGFGEESPNKVGDAEAKSWLIQPKVLNDNLEFKTYKINDIISIVHGKLK